MKNCQPMKRMKKAGKQNMRVARWFPCSTLNKGLPKTRHTQVWLVLAGIFQEQLLLQEAFDSQFPFSACRLPSTRERTGGVLVLQHTRYLLKHVRVSNKHEQGK